MVIQEWLGCSGVSEATRSYFSKKTSVTSGTSDWVYQLVLMLMIQSG